MKVLFAVSPIVVLFIIVICFNAGAQYTVQNLDAQVAQEQTHKVCLTSNIKVSYGVELNYTSDDDVSVAMFVDDKVYEWTNGSLVSIFCTEGYIEYEYIFITGEHLHLITTDDGILDEIHSETDIYSFNK